MRVKENLKKTSLSDPMIQIKQNVRNSVRSSLVLQKMDAISVFKTILMKAGLSEPK